MSELIKVNTGVLVGHTAAPIDWAKFADFKQKCYAARVGYGYGKKDPDCGSGEVDFTEIDCSGFVRTLLMYAAGGPAEGALRHFPDGSYTQGEWMGRMGFKPTTPDAAALLDGHVRCYFHHADALDETGHAWIAVNGHSVESSGGRGPNERPWNVMLSAGHRLDQLASVGFVLL